MPFPASTGVPRVQHAFLGVAQRAGNAAPVHCCSCGVMSSSCSTSAGTPWCSSWGHTSPGLAGFSAQEDGDMQACWCR